jgi:hypothetical protein
MASSVTKSAHPPGLGLRRRRLGAGARARAGDACDSQLLVLREVVPGMTPAEFLATLAER